MRYNQSTILKTQEGKQYFKAKLYPNITLSEDDVYVITTIADRLDLLADTYYGDAELWWIIAMANNNITRGSMFPTPGTQMRIPINISNTKNQFEQFNKAR